MDSRRESFLEAAGSPNNFENLKNLAQSYLDSGISSEQLLAELDGIRELVPDGDEDVVLDVMDLLVGWCAPSARLVPKHAYGSRVRPWGRHFSPEELVAAWRSFVEQCERGYSMNIYEYENDLSCRAMIHETMEDPTLASSSDARAFKEEVAQVDDRFRRLLQPGVLIGDADSPWWKRGVPRSAGGELASDFRDIHGVDVELAPE